MHDTPCRRGSREAFHRSGKRPTACRFRRSFLAGENVRVLKWLLERVEGRGAANETPIGYVPAKNELPLVGMKISEEAVNELLRVNTEDWETELEDSKQFFRKFGGRLPRQISEEH